MQVCFHKAALPQRNVCQPLVCDDDAAPVPAFPKQPLCLFFSYQNQLQSTKADIIVFLSMATEDLALPPPFSKHPLLTHPFQGHLLGEAYFV